MKKKWLATFVACLMGGALFCGLPARTEASAAESELANVGLVGFEETSTSTGVGTPQIVNSPVVSFNAPNTTKSDGLLYKEELKGAYTVEFTAANYADGGSVFMVSLGNKSATEIGGDYQINKEDSLNFVVTVGAVDMATSPCGYKVYDDTSYGAVTDAIKLANTFGWYSNSSLRFKLDVKANGDVDFYAKAVISSEYIYLYTLSKTPDNAENDGTTDGYFAFMSTTTANVTFKDFALNGTLVDDYGNGDVWNVFGTSHEFAYKDTVTLADNDAIVSDFYLNDGALETGDVVFDITYNAVTNGTHSWTGGGWYTFGLTFAMEEKGSARTASNSIESQWVTLVRVQKDGAVQTKASGDGSGASDGFLVNGAQVTVRAVAKKGGTLEIYAAYASSTAPTTIYQTYENMDFNGFLGFFTSENESLLADGTHGDLTLKNVEVKVNKSAICYDYEATMTVGASARTIEPYGLRFRMEMTGEDYTTLQNAVKSGVYESVTYGMYILPYEYVQENALTVENLYGEQRVYGWSKEADKTQILRLADTEMTVVGEKAYLYGAIVNIKPENLEKLYVGVGFLELKRTNGTTEYKLVYGYAATDTGATDTNNVRSVYTVAKDAYADVSAEAPSQKVKDWLKKNYIDPVENAQ